MAEIIDFPLEEVDLPVCDECGNGSWIILIGYGFVCADCEMTVTAFEMLGQHLEGWDETA